MKFNIFKNSVSSVQPIPQGVDGFWTSNFASIGLGEYSDLILKMVITPIFDELKKVEYYVEPRFESNRTAKEVVNFLNKKYPVIYKYFFKRGYCAVHIENDGSIVFDNLAAIKSNNGFEFTLSNPLSSATFELNFFGKSQMALLDSIFENVNTGMTAQKAITKILGQFTIFSQEKQKDNERVVTLTDEERNRFATKFTALLSGNNVGTSVELTNANLKRDTIVFPIEKLQIVDNVSFCILIIAGVLNVPYDLIPISGKSTYSNQESAISYLRTHTVSGIAENMLELGQKIMKAKDPTLINAAINFRIVEDPNATKPINPQNPTQ